MNKCAKSLFGRLSYSADYRVDKLAFGALSFGGLSFGGLSLGC